jgi:hypothetical protein
VSVIYREAQLEGIVVQACPVIKRDPISKITNTKRTGGVALVVELLLGKSKSLSSILSTGTKAKKKERALHV